ncbi:unnamed protein product [Ectocarpus sp. 12 AP-2014]
MQRASALPPHPISDIAASSDRRIETFLRAERIARRPLCARAISKVFRAALQRRAGSIGQRMGVKVFQQGNFFNDATTVWFNCRLEVLLMLFGDRVYATVVLFLSNVMSVVSRHSAHSAPIPAHVFAAIEVLVDVRKVLVHA